jgi:hypothetical protein
LDYLWSFGVFSKFWYVAPRKNLATLKLGVAAVRGAVDLVKDVAVATFFWLSNSLMADALSRRNSFFTTSASVKSAQNA